jgi:hypothetical protein
MSRKGKEYGKWKNGLPNTPSVAERSADSLVRANLKFTPNLADKGCPRSVLESALGVI